MMTICLVLPVRCVLRTLAISSDENPLSGKPLSKWRISCSMTAASEFLFLQLT